jgi:hypothetical protein
MRRAFTAACGGGVYVKISPRQRRRLSPRIYIIIIIITGRFLRVIIHHNIDFSLIRSHVSPR